MSKQPTLSDVTNPLTSAGTINSNWDAIQASFQNTISRDGSTPNNMEADLDLDGNDILNVASISTQEILLSGQSLSPLVTAASEAEAYAESAAISAAAALASEEYVESVEESLPEWKGAWTTSTSYGLGDLVRNDGSSYICTEAHTSGTFSTDLSASKWELFAQKGAAGAGAGDMISTNNLSDLDDASTARDNLGVAIGSAVQAYDATLQSLSSLGTGAGKIAYTTGVDTWAEATITSSGRALLDDADAAAQRTTLGASPAPLDEDDFASDSDTQPPTQQSAKAYIASQLLGVGGGAGVNLKVFTSSGTWNRDSDTTKALVFVTGSGAGAGTDPAEDAAGAGGTAIALLDVSSISSATLTVGGNRSGDSNGSNGNSSTWSDGTNTIVAYGGRVGSNSTTPTGGLLNIPGGTGSHNGAASFWGQGGGYNASGDGGDAAAYGAGGGCGTGVSSDGGAGKSGVIMVIEFK